GQAAVAMGSAGQGPPIPRTAPPTAGDDRVRGPVGAAGPLGGAAGRRWCPAVDGRLLEPDADPELGRDRAVEGGEVGRRQAARAPSSGKCSVVTLPRPV